MQFTLGMPFLGVLGKFYRNRKGLIRQCFVFIFMFMYCIIHIDVQAPSVQIVQEETTNVTQSHHTHAQVKL